MTERPKPAKPLAFDIAQFIALHEAGHAVLSEYVGVTPFWTTITDNGGECFHAMNESQEIPLISLAGYLATYLHPSGLNIKLIKWKYAQNDIQTFKAYQGWMGASWTYASGRKAVLSILKDRQSRLFEIRDQVMNQYLQDVKI